MQLIATQSFAHESDFDVNEESAGSVLSYRRLRGSAHAIGCVMGGTGQCLIGQAAASEHCATRRLVSVTAAACRAREFTLNRHKT